MPIFSDGMKTFGQVPLRDRCQWFTSECPPGYTPEMAEITDDEVPDLAAWQCYEGFAWAVPAAFSSALSSFRFEQGDVLYRDRSAYGPLSGRPSDGAVAIQVLEPARSSRVNPAEAEGDRRAANWLSEVRLERIDLARGVTEERILSQGRLLMALWTGEETWLGVGSAEPPMPLAARDLAVRLSQTVGAFERCWAKKRGTGFLFVVDLASDASRVKARSVEVALATLGTTHRHEFLPSAAGVESPELFHPTLRVRGVMAGGASREAVESALRDALYAGGLRRGEGDDETPDRFSTARHGLLVGLGD